MCEFCDNITNRDKEIRWLVRSTYAGTIIYVSSQMDIIVIIVIIVIWNLY